MTTEQTDKMEYYFAVRQTNPNGKWVVEGPYRTRDQAMAEREKAKAIDMEVTPWFVANSKKEAEKHCKIHL